MDHKFKGLRTIQQKNRKLSPSTRKKSRWKSDEGKQMAKVLQNGIEVEHNSENDTGK